MRAAVEADLDDGRCYTAALPTANDSRTRPRPHVGPAPRTPMTRLHRWITAEARVRALWIALLIVNAIVYLQLSIGSPVCPYDCDSYIELMGRGSLREYLDTAAHMFRSWFVPAFFSLFGKYTLANALTIVLAQTLLLHASWLVFAKAISGLFDGWLARVAFVLVCLSMYAQQYYILNHYLLSDSVAMATALWFLSTAVAFDRVAARIGTWAAVALLVATALFATGARDASMAVVVIGGAYVVAAHRRALALRHVAVALVALALVVGNQAKHARTRHTVNTGNLLVGFVVPTPPVRDFFLARGLPPDLVERGRSFVRQPWCTADLERMQAYRAALEGVSYRDLRRASRTWMLWLATNPGYVLAQAYRDIDCILGQSFGRSAPFHYLWKSTADTSTRPPDGRFPAIQQGTRRLAPSDFVGVRTRFWTTLAAAAVLAASLRRRRRPHVMATLLLVAVGLSNAIAAYFSDLWEPSEMLRHAMLGSILFNVGFLACIVSTIALLLERRGSAGVRQGAPGAVDGADDGADVPPGRTGTALTERGAAPDRRSTPRPA